MPEVIVIDEIGTELEAQAARTIAERGVQLVGTAHGRTLENLLVNPTLADLVGGVQAVTLGDEEARRRGTQKTVLERKAPPTFDVLVEQESWRQVILHQDVAAAVDELLRGHAPVAEQRTRDEEDHVTTRKIIVKSQDALAVQGGFAPAEFEGWNVASFNQRPTGRGRTLADPRRDYGDLTLVPDEAEDDDLEVEEPTGTTGAPARSAAASGPHRRRTVRIYPFGISRERLEQSARQLRVPVEISRDQSHADAVITLKTYYRRQGELLRHAQSARKPIYVLRTNTVAQMAECLARIFELERADAPLATGASGSENPTIEAMQEAEDAIHRLLNHNIPRVELAPQNAYVRRLQHQVASRYNLESRSLGREPNRRVQIYGR
jgi:R3H domain